MQLEVFWMCLIWCKLWHRETIQVIDGEEVVLLSMHTGSAQEELSERIYQIVRRIPTGSVATYGDVAAIVGACDARTVGNALRDLPREQLSEVPWHRVINSAGRISTYGSRQRYLLELEGIEFDESGCIDLARFRWAALRPGTEASAPTSGRLEDEQEQLRLF